MAHGLAHLHAVRTWCCEREGAVAHKAVVERAPSVRRWWGAVLTSVTREMVCAFGDRAPYVL